MMANVCDQSAVLVIDFCGEVYGITTLTTVQLSICTVVSLVMSLANNRKKCWHKVGGDVVDKQKQKAYGFK